jgi:membrane associated rhomboid family serine protease
MEDGIDVNTGQIANRILATFKRQAARNSAERVYTLDEIREVEDTLKRQAARNSAEQQGLRDFQAALKTATRRVVVTPLLVVACVAVFGAMVVRGVSPAEPSIEALLDWGGNFGPYVAVDHEYWRLFTSMFLHIGLLHLFFNMWCLLAAGPMIERFFGNLGFAAVYVASGLGGALASVAVHPLLVSAGASGAIFGIFGALVGFLVAQHQSIPTALLKPLRASATSFIAYNIVFGLMSARVDNAAHLGGLATGLVCGLLLHRRLPIIPGRRGVVRRILATAGLSIGLVLAVRTIADTVAAKPNVRSASHETNRASQSFNQLADAVRQPLQNYEHAGQQMNQLLDRLKRFNSSRPDDPALIDRLVRQLESDLETLRRTPQSDQELHAILDAAIATDRELRDALKGLRAYLDHPDPRLFGGPEGISRKIDQSNRAFKQIVTLRGKYIKAHGLVLLDEPAKDNRLPGQTPERSPRRRR